MWDSRFKRRDMETSWAGVWEERRTESVRVRTLTTATNCCPLLMVVVFFLQCGLSSSRAVLSPLSLEGNLEVWSGTYRPGASMGERKKQRLNNSRLEWRR